MSDSRILVNLQRCTGCWTCSMACKVGNRLEDDEWRQTVRTLGSGEGIDRPAGIWPDLHESWMPLWSKSCTKCPDRIKEDEQPYCVYSCPNAALSFGADVDGRMAGLKEQGFRIFQLPAWDKGKDAIFYAGR